MAELAQHLLAFNRGIVSPLALSRIDLKRYALSAESMTNWMPRKLGSMMLRPGFGHIGSTASNAAARFAPFVFSYTDTALLEFTDMAMRVWIDETLVTRPSVSTAVANGSFTTDLASWTDADETGAASTWHSSGYMQLLGTGSTAAIRRQQVTVAGGDQNVEHALRVVVVQGRVAFRVGSSSGGEQYVAEAMLGVGTHSLAFTPTGDFHIQLSSRLSYPVQVDSVTVESSGVMSLPTPWVAADRSLLRFQQSADVTYVACAGYHPYKIERRGDGRSWSVVKYQPDNGPFRPINTTPITITPNGLSGSISLLASQPVFRSGHVGALFRIESVGQFSTVNLSAGNTFSNEIRVQGVGDQRIISVDVSGTWVGTITVQTSIGEPGAWTSTTTATGANGAFTFNDGLDNQIVYVRVGFETGEYTSGTATVAVAYASGSIVGVCRISLVTDELNASAAVLSDMGAITGSSAWYEGAWSDRRGWPSAVAIHEGRLWWAGLDNTWASVSDGYEDFDPDTEGDSGPISRSIGYGPVESINWLLPLQRLLMGTAASEIAIRSSSLDEPLTPTNYNIKDASTHGSAPLSPIKRDKHGFFVEVGATDIFELNWDFEIGDYNSSEVTEFWPEMGAAGIVHIAIQRKPDTRIHVVRSDGTVAVNVHDETENVKCWVEIETDGVVEDVVVLPGAVEDKVYYVIKRTIDGSTVRYLEKWALESECQGGTVNKQADSFLYFAGPLTTVTGLGHLEGEDVVVWANGASLNNSSGDIATFTVDSGSITLPASYTDIVVGLPYQARLKSTKLAFTSQKGSPLEQLKLVQKLGLILHNTHHRGIKYGPSFDTMEDLPQAEDWAVVSTGTVHAHFDAPTFAFQGEYSTDPRLCLEANAPRPCTVLAAVIELEQNE